MLTLTQSICRTCSIDLSSKTDITRRQCKQCAARQYKEWDLKNLDANKARRRNHHKTPISRNNYYQRTYNISFDDAIALWQSQDGCCDACKMPIKEPGKSRGTHTDHCHLTGQVRGILCHGCNVSLGLMKEDLNKIMGLLEYAKKHQHIMLT